MHPLAAQNRRAVPVKPATWRGTSDQASQLRGELPRCRHPKLAPHQRPIGGHTASGGPFSEWQKRSSNGTVDDRWHVLPFRRGWPSMPGQTRGLAQVMSTCSGLSLSDLCALAASPKTERSGNRNHPTESSHMPPKGGPCGSTQVSPTCVGVLDDAPPAANAALWLPCQSNPHQARKPVRLLPSKERPVTTGEISCRSQASLVRSAYPTALVARFPLPQVASWRVGRQNRRRDFRMYSLHGEPGDIRQSAYRRSYRTNCRVAKTRGRIGIVGRRVPADRYRHPGVSGLACLTRSLPCRSNPSTRSRSAWATLYGERRSRGDGPRNHPERFCRADEYRRDSPSRALALSAGVSCSRLPRCAP